jgi:RNA polymerase sigma-70 factor (ECF subfamily)
VLLDDTQPTWGTDDVAIDLKVGAVNSTGKSFAEEFESFYARERRLIVGLAYVLSGSRSGAEDLAQDAFVAAYRSWEQVSGFDDPGAWVRRVVANRATSRLRRKAAEARALVRLGRPNRTIPPLDPEADLIWREVRRLPLRQAQAIALRYLDGQEVSGIARILECSENTVHTHLRRGRESLSRRLADREPL